MLRPQEPISPKAESVTDLWEHVICQVLATLDNGIVLVRGRPRRGDDQDEEFWSLPSSLFSNQLCHLHDEDPSQYARKIVTEQTGLKVESLELARLQTFRKKHPPKFIYAAKVSGTPTSSKTINEVGIFELSRLPSNLGPHKELLTSLIRSINKSLV